ncbi:hypothetical protein SASPL_140570 [Salvia splendens]|uniref:CASP-like protein n=1 Tax=Salvia splendens TaxID=180675 RepID=A0A8X8WQP7_SALSN|nr:hypothetical protein SASPL_140570 [Salvia splendens]
MSYPQPQDYNNGESEEKGSRFAITTLSARIGAMISFIVAIAVFQTNDAKIDTGYVYTYKDFRSYKSLSLSLTHTHHFFYILRRVNLHYLLERL